jgi:ATP-binding cassette, subfamily C, bacterial CydCD
LRQNSRLLKLALSDQSRLLISIAAGVSGGVFAISQAYLLSRVISGVFLDGHTLAGSAADLAFLSLVILLRALSVWVSEVCAGNLSLHIKTKLRDKLFSHLLALGPLHIQEERAGELIQTTIEGIESLDQYISQYLPQLFLSALIPLSILVVVFPIDLVSGLILLLTAPLIPIFMILIGSLADSLTRKQWQVLSRMSAYFLDVLQGLTTLKIFDRSRDQIKIIAAVSERYRETTMQVLRVAFLSALSLELIATLSTAILAVGIGLRLLYTSEGNGFLGISFQQAFFVLLLAPEYYLPLRLLGARFHAGMAGATAAGRIFEILDTPPTTSSTIPATKQNPAVPELRTSRPPSITFANVSYTYPDGRPALRGVSFELAPGQVTALVGPSGSGKSSLAQLLLRFIDPQEGVICIDGLSLDQLEPQNWRQNIAFVSQNPYLFSGTVASNIAFGKPSADRDSVIIAAKQALAHDFILSLPDGYETLVGERGIRLSGGEAQRIALARAFLKDAPIVILDEASANLDPETEACLFSGMQKLMQERTVLIIAHRLATVMSSDQILVLEKGRLVESGDHSTLSKTGGAYQRLVKASIGAHHPGTLDTTSGIGSEYIGQETLPQLPALPSANRWNQPPKHWPVLLRLLSILASFKRQVFLSVLLGFATIGSGIGLMGTSAYIISSAALRPSIADLQIAIVGVRFFGISRGVFRYLERLVSHQVTFRVLSSLRVWFYSAIEPLAPARLLQFQSGDLFSRITGDIANLENFYVRAAAPPLTALLVAAGAAITLSIFDLRLSLALLAFMALQGIALPLIMRRLGWRPGRMLQRARAELNMLMVDGIRGMADLFAYNQYERQEKTISAAGSKLSNLQNVMARLAALQSASLSLLSNLGMLAVLCIAVPMVSSGQIEGVYLAVIILVALSSFEGLQPLPLAAQYLESNLEAGRRLFELVDATPEVSNPIDPLPLPENPTLKVEKLTFAYPVSVKNNAGQGNGSIAFTGPYSEISLALEQLSFELQPGKRLAIVGPSGSGKTTLVNLILRFWEYGRSAGSGQISLDGHELNLFDQQEIRGLFGVVSQNTYLFHASVRDNLLIASPNATENQIVEATRRAEIHDFITSLPKGYDTWIGEQGLSLSAGERQRLAIARALLKGAPLLLLDEPTANLDPVTESQVLGSIHQLMEGRTTLMITHRLVGMEWMDEIIVLKAGRLVERGRHTDLLCKGGLYRRMWDLQNQYLIETA